MTMSGPPSSLRSRTVVPVSIRPPRAVNIAAIVAEIVEEPPTATGQPKRWAAVPSAMPIADDMNEPRGRKACAATPANSARASSVCHRRASSPAGIAAYAPNRASATGWSGTCNSGRRKSSVIRGNRSVRGPKTRW